MIVQDQREIIAALSHASTYGGPAASDPVERIDTHSSIVFLVGGDAYKLKRAVRYDFLDYSTLALRERACRAELKLNQRSAPELYLDVVAITRADGALRVGGSGEPVEWLLHMRRFDTHGLMDRLALGRQLPLAIIGPLAREIARLHLAAEPRVDHGGVEGMRWVVEGNVQALAAESGVIDPEARDRLARLTRSALDRGAGELDWRRRDRLVRTCHGDLHLGNIVVIDGRPVLFDAVEFNDEISCIDVLYDVAFVLMDLWRLDLRGHANELLNAYLMAFGSVDGLSLLPLFLASRAAVRAKTSLAARALQTDAGQADQLAAVARDYIAHALAFLDPPPARLVAIGGRSGSGKSTLARGLAPSLGAAPGAIVVRSDVVRKALFGVPETERLGLQAYTADVTRTVYETLEQRARLLLAAGHSVVLDAVFDDPAARLRIARLAEAANVPFAGVWIEARPDVLVDRVAARRGDPSDATAQVVSAQLARDTGVIDWTIVDGGQPIDRVESAVRRELGVSELAEHGEQ